MAINHNCYPCHNLLRLLLEWCIVLGVLGDDTLISILHSKLFEVIIQSPVIDDHIDQWLRRIYRNTEIFSKATVLGENGSWILNKQHPTEKHFVWNSLWESIKDAATEAWKRHPKKDYFWIINARVTSKVIKKCHLFIFFSFFISSAFCVFSFFRFFLILKRSRKSQSFKFSKIWKQHQLEGQLFETVFFHCKID